MSLLKFLKQIFSGIGEDKIGQQSAAFAYIAIFSIGPLLLILISLISFVFGERAVEGALYGQLSDAVGPETAKTLQDVVANTHQTGGGLLALIIGVVGLLLGASGISAQLQNSFDSIFSIVPDPKAGIKRTVYVKINNILLVLLGGVVGTASVIASTVIVSAGTHLSRSLGIPNFALELLNNLASLMVFTLILFFVYKAIPNAKVPAKILLATSFIVGLLFMVGKIVLGLFIGKNGTASAYGAAASLITLLLWVYYSGEILLIGAEGMKVYAANHNLIYEPKKYNLKRISFKFDLGENSSRFAQSFVNGLKNQNKK